MTMMVTEMHHALVLRLSGVPCPCPRCREIMILRERKADKNKFWGCWSYPKCKGTRPYVKEKGQTEMANKNRPRRRGRGGGGWSHSPTSIGRKGSDLTHTFVCDRCRKERYSVSMATPPAPPKGWSTVGEDEHLCEECKESK